MQKKLSVLFKKGYISVHLSRPSDYTPFQSLTLSMIIDFIGDLQSISGLTQFKNNLFDFYDGPKDFPRTWLSAIALHCFDRAKIV